MELAKVRPISLPPGRRVLVMSDIHGNLTFFKTLLRQVGFCHNDILILVGDLVEKGVDSLKTLRYIMELSRTYEVHIVCGNCDNLTYNFIDQIPEIPESFYVGFLCKTWREKSLLWQMSEEVGITPTGIEDFPEMRRRIAEHFEPELTFLRALPTILISDKFLFVHGGIPREDHLEELEAWPLMKDDDFLGQGRSFQHWVVVGHWPVTLYRPSIPSAAPIILPDRHIISIDGGCQLKLDGQLNVLIIPDGTSEDFSFESCDGFPTAVALDHQDPSEHSTNIRWHEHGIEVLEWGEEFCRCRHPRAGEIDILTEYISKHHDGYTCKDSTDYLLPVEPGDTLAIVRTTSRGYLCKKGSVTGWYRGRIHQD